MKQLIHNFNLKLKLNTHQVEFNDVDIMEVIEHIEFTVNVYIDIEDNKFILKARHNISKSFNCVCEKENGFTFSLHCDVDEIELLRLTKYDGSQVVAEIGDFQFIDPCYGYSSKKLTIFYKII